MEKILCSAIWYNDDKKYVHQPKNLRTGYVICGHRHHNCFTILKILKESSYDKTKITQGFLSSENKFHDRKSASKIAQSANQINEDKKLLFSEDLW